MYILDTDHMSVLERGGASSLALTLRLSAIADSHVATSIISYEEQCKGWLSKIAREQDEALLYAYERFSGHLEIYTGMTVLPFDRYAYANFEFLRKSKLRIGTPDLKIAAIALAHDATVLTRNLKHFRMVPNLRSEDWTVETTA